MKTIAIFSIEPVEAFLLIVIGGTKKFFSKFFPLLLRLGSLELFPEIEKVGVHHVSRQSGVEVENEVTGIVLCPLRPFHIRSGIWCWVATVNKI